MQSPWHDFHAKPRHLVPLPAPQPPPALTVVSTTWKAVHTQGAVKPKNTHGGSQALGMILAASLERAMALLGEFQHSSVSPQKLRMHK